MLNFETTARCRSMGYIVLHTYIYKYIVYTSGNGESGVERERVRKGNCMLNSMDLRAKLVAANEQHHSRFRLLEKLCIVCGFVYLLLLLLFSPDSVCF